MTITLTDRERLSLALQYKILSVLEPSQWDRHLEIVESGYESRYWELTNWLTTPVPSHKTRFVEDVLIMYEALQDSIARLPADTREALSSHVTGFFGFDGNNELDLLCYLRFLWSENRWVSLRRDNDGNSHFPIAGMYQRMLIAFAEENGGEVRKTRDFRHEPLSVEAINRIAAAAGIKDAA